MKRHACLMGTLLTAALLARPAQAFIEDPFVQPTHPTPETPISVRVYAADCHGFSDLVDEAELETVAPGQLRLITDGSVLPPAHPFCIWPDYVYRFEIGTLPAGIYTLQLFIRDPFFPEPLPFGSVTFTVAPPATIPAAASPGLLLLGLLIAAAGVAMAGAPRG